MPNYYYKDYIIFKDSTGSYLYRKAMRGWVGINILSSSSQYAKSIASIYLHLIRSWYADSFETQDKLKKLLEIDTGFGLFLKLHE